MMIGASRLRSDLLRELRSTPGALHLHRFGVAKQSQATRGPPRKCRADTPAQQPVQGVPENRELAYPGSAETQAGNAAAAESQQIVVVIRNRAILQRSAVSPRPYIPAGRNDSYRTRAFVS